MVMVLCLRGVDGIIEGLKYNSRSVGICTSGTFTSIQIAPTQVEIDAACGGVAQGYMSSA